MLRWEDGTLSEPPWMRRLHHPPLTGVRAHDHPEILGDVFAWNKLFRRSFWESAGLSWPERIRYEDQPTTTRAYLAGTFDVLDEPVYHWRIRADGTSITQQRASVPDLVDRWETKRMTLASVVEHGDPEVTSYVVDRVLAGDLLALLPADPRRERRVVAAAAGRGAARSGDSARWCTAGCRPCTGSAAGWSSRTGAPTRPR